MNNKFDRSLLIISLSVLTVRVFAAGPTTTAVAPTTATATPGAPATPKPEYLNYTFYADRYRDPFIPLIGEGRGDQGIDPAPQIAALALKGIVSDANGRMALLTSGVNSYILRGGRLYDGRNRMVKKISGVIKAESVVLIGSDRTVRELRQKPVL